MLAKRQGFPRKLGGCAGLDPRLRSAVSAGVGDGERGLRRGLRAPGVGLKGHPKTGQRRSPQNRPMKAARDQVVLPRLAVIGQACFGTPTPWATLENVAMMEEAVEHGSHGGTIP